MKKLHLVVLMLLLFTLSFATINVTLAQENITDRMKGAVSDVDLPGIEEGDDLTTADAKAQAIVGSIINSFLSLFGIIFMILIIYGGYKWMMARGAEEDVKKARDTIRGAVIGLIITLAAYSISLFVSNLLQTAVN